LLDITNKSDHGVIKRILEHTLLFLDFDTVKVKRWTTSTKKCALRILRERDKKEPMIVTGNTLGATVREEQAHELLLAPQDGFKNRDD
jgi:hypothetical protein